MVAAEDIVQEVFMQLWLGRDRLDEHRSLYNLLFTMTKHRIYDHFRRRYNLEALRRPLSEFDAVSDEAESPESGLEAEQLRRRSHGRSPPCRRQRRTIFALSRQENLSRQEIARRLGVSVRTVDKHLELALREIRLRIKDFQWVLLLFLFRKERQRGCFREPDAEPDSPRTMPPIFHPRAPQPRTAGKNGATTGRPAPLKQTFRHFPKTSFSTAANR